jgi:hypothetical protein
MGLGLACLVLMPSLLTAEPPKVLSAPELAARIDQLIAARWQERGVQPAEASSDAEFLRRVYLDLVGRIPEVMEVRVFLADKSADKRAKLIEKLLTTGVNHTNHFINVWRDLMLPQTNNPQLRFLAGGLDAWLREQLRNQVGYDVLVRRLLTAPLAIDRANPRAFDPTEASARVFYQANENRPENLAASTSKLFLGVKLECAQCHDHPFAKWTKQQFWEYAAFFSGIQTRGPNPAFAQITEKPDQREITIPGTDKKVQARFLDGTEPKWKDGANTRAVLAEWMTTADNPFFARAAANRLWEHFFGSELVEECDSLGGEDSKPLHQDLLDELARQLAANQFDEKYLMRAITLSKTYQRSSKVSHESQNDPALYARMALKGLTGKQLYESFRTATGLRGGDTNPNQRFGAPGVETAFLTQFSNQSDKRTEYQTSILQALAMMNGRLMSDMVEALNLERAGHFAAVVDAPFLDTTEKKVETLFLLALSRPPSETERERFVKYVNAGGAAGDTKKALADVFWALLNSTEFMFNH